MPCKINSILMEKHPGFPYMEKHPGFPYMGQLEGYINGFPVLILTSKNSLQKTIGCTNHCVVSPNWFAITRQINHEQHLNVLAYGAMRSLLMHRMLTVNGINIGRNFNLFFIRILSRRHYLGHYPNHAEDLFKSGLQMYELQNYSTALQIWAQAALLQHGLSHAYVSNMLLGIMVRNGLGVVRDYTEAVRLFQDTAACGFSCSQYELGNMFRDGLGVTQDKSEANRWWQLAAAQGYYR